MNRPVRHKWFRAVLACCAGVMLSACSKDEAVVLPGTVEWDRVAVLAETLEPVREIRVHEGDQVKTGDVLLLLDDRRVAAEIAAAGSERDVARAQLASLRRGARREEIIAVRADAERLRAESENAASQRNRINEMHRQGLVALADVDRAEALAKSTAAALRAAESRARELENGARSEDIDAAVARVAALDARLQALQLGREKLTVVAPRDGRVDALPFRVGDQPVLGATLVSVLAGDAPYVRVYVPAALRASLQIKTRFLVSVQGVEKPFAGTLRSMQSDAAFTPYYALVGDDAARLVYRAEVVLTDAAAKSLPAGLPATALWQPEAGQP